MLPLPRLAGKRRLSLRSAFAFVGCTATHFHYRTSQMSSSSKGSPKATPAFSASSSFFARHGVQQLPSLSGATVSEEHAILEPFRYTCSVAGKGMRSRIIEVFNYWLNVSEACRVQTAAIVEKLHNASLIIGSAHVRCHDSRNLRAYARPVWLGRSQRRLHPNRISVPNPPSPLTPQTTSKTARCSGGAVPSPTRFSARLPASTARISFISRHSTTRCVLANRRSFPRFWTS